LKEMDTLERIKNIYKKIDLLEVYIKELDKRDKEKEKRIQTLQTLLEEIYKYHAEQLRKSHTVTHRTQEGH